jgi:hypothetical protein
MLEQLDQQIKDAFTRAGDCLLKAKAAKSAEDREDWLLLERRYVLLAHCLSELVRHLEKSRE